MKFVNVTPHSIAFCDQDGNVLLVVDPSGQVARLTTSTDVVGQCMGIPMRATKFGQIQGLPDPKEGVVYIASTLVAGRAQRPDVVSPDTGPTAIRKDGQVVGVTGVQVFA